MSISITRGNIFTSKCQTLVNTVNCVGVMGAGIALECRLRWPNLFKNYVEMCAKSLINIGDLWLYKENDVWILNFPTKRHWKEPSQEEYLHAGLRKFLDSYERWQIESIAFPLLGAQNGGIDPEKSLSIMEAYLNRCSIPVEIYQYDPLALDDLYDEFKSRMLGMTLEEIKIITGLRVDHINRLLKAFNDPKICQVNQLIRVEGIGAKTIEKVFLAAREMDASKKFKKEQLTLPY